MSISSFLSSKISYTYKSYLLCVFACVFWTYFINFFQTYEPLIIGDMVTPNLKYFWSISESSGFDIFSLIREL